MNLDEAIRQEEENIVGCKHGAEVLEEQHMPLNAQRYRECAETHEQLCEWLKELKMLKEFMEEDFGMLCICALRYCYGRRTYLPSTVQKIVRNHFGYLSDRDLRVILEGEEHQIRTNLWGDDCDKLDWERFYGDLKEYMKNKEVE